MDYFIYHPMLTASMLFCLIPAFLAKKNKACWIAFCITILATNIAGFDLIAQETENQLKASILYNIKCLIIYLLSAMLLLTFLKPSSKFFNFLAAGTMCLAFDLFLSGLLSKDIISGELRHNLSYYVYIIYYLACAASGYTDLRNDRISTYSINRSLCLRHSTTNKA